MASRDQYLLLRLSFLPSLLVCGLLLFAVPSFIEVYKSFGTELPFQTAMLVRWYRVLAFLPFLFLLAWFFWPTPASRGVAALLIALALSFVLFVFGVWAAYSPIFILGSAPTG
jgi:hypothetical protein